MGSGAMQSSASTAGRMCRGLAGQACQGATSALVSGRRIGGEQKTISSQIVGRSVEPFERPTAPMIDDATFMPNLMRQPAACWMGISSWLRSQGRSSPRTNCNPYQQCPLARCRLRTAAGVYVTSRSTLYWGSDPEAPQMTGEG